jgi:hypothetical protein
MKIARKGTGNCHPKPKVGEKISLLLPKVGAKTKQ